MHLLLPHFSSMFLFLHSLSSLPPFAAIRAPFMKRRPPLQSRNIGVVLEGGTTNLLTLRVDWIWLRAGGILVLCFFHCSRVCELFINSNSTSHPNKMGIYEPFHQVSMWGDSFKVDGSLNSIASPMEMVNTSMENKSECISHESREPSGDDQETSDKAGSKVLRRLAQNREAARKSRLRKKAYVQQLESSRLKLMQLELEIEKATKQGLYIGHSALDGSYMGSSGAINSGIAVFEIEYGQWVEGQHRHNEELRNALHTNASDIQLHPLVESSLNHYSNLFRMKADVAKFDIFYLISGVWKASVERLFLWIGGSRPSQLLNIIVPQLEPLTDRQMASINNLRQSSQQAEDALSLGLDKLQQSLVHSIAADAFAVGNYGFQMAVALDKIEALEGFVSQADHLRQQTLLHMSRILTTSQAAQGLLIMGEYFNRLRTLSSLWTARPCDPS